jgi:DNA-binding NarL/FixJ family response regulator
LTQVEPFSVVYSGSGMDGLSVAFFGGKPDVLIQEFGLCRRRESCCCEVHPAALSGIKTIVIGVPDKEEDILACIEQEGAAGYLLMNASLHDLLMSINAVMRGETLCSPRIASLAFDRVSRLSRQVDRVHTINDSKLTRREAEIVRLIDDGLSNKEIAARLHIEVSTVKNHVHNILDKLQLHDRQSAANYIKAQGLTVSRP